MVVNEETSSIQAKGTKTVIAVAAAMVAGGACATQWVDSPVKDGSNVTDTTTWDKVAETNSFVLTATGGAKTPAPFLAVNGEVKEFTQQLWVTGTGAAAQASGIWTSGEKAKLVNKGTIYVTTGKDGVTWQNAALGADAGATVTNAGKIVVKNAHGMRIGTSTAASTIINDEAGAIYVEETGVGMELGGHSGSTAVNNGLISVGKKAETKTAYTIGVQFEGNSDTFTNNGTISAADADSAILVKKDAANSTINLEKTSSVDGLIAVLGTGTTINLNGTKDTLTIATSEKPENAGTTINVNDGADVELTDGKGATFDAVNVKDGKFSASIWKVDNTFKSVTVEEDGIFNVTKLNSRVDGEKIDLEKGIKGDRLLIARNQLITLKGGQLWTEGAAFTGTMKIGSAGQQTGSLAVENGDYSFDSVQVYKSGALAVNGGTLTINDLDTEFGKTTVSGGTLTVTGDMKVGTVDSVTVTTGELRANAKELFQVTGTGAEEKVNWNSKVAGITAKGGYVTVLDAVELDAATIKQAVSRYNNAGLTFANLTVKLEEGTTDIGFDSGFGTAMLGQVVKVSGGTAVLGAAKVGVGSLKVADTDKALSVTGDGTLLIGGLTGNVVNGVTQLDTMTVNDGTLQLGKDATDAGNVNVKALTVKNLNVTGSYTAADVSVRDTATVEGMLDAAKLTVAQTATVAKGGVLAVDQVTGAGIVTVSSGAVLALGERVWQEAQTEGQALFVARVAEAGSYLPQVDATVNANEAGSFVTTNAQTGVAKATAAMAKAGVAYDAAKNAVLYVDKTLGISTHGKLTVGTLQSATTAGEVAVGSNGIFVIDSSFINSADFVIDGAARLSSAASIVVDGLNSKGTVNLAKTWNSAGTNITFADNNAFLKGTVTKTAAADAATNPNSAVLTVVTDTAAFGTNTELSDIVDEHLGTDTNAGLRNLLLAVGNEQGDFIQNGLLTSRGERALEEVFALPVTAGTYNVAYDAAEQVTGAIQRHNTAALQGTGVWADVYYSSNAGKEIYGGQGYSADIYGGVIGVDYTAACGAKMGVALTVGTGDADSEKSVSKFGNDADFYGLSVYAGKNVGDTSLYVSADASYLWLDNDITGNVAGASAAESIDSSVFTIGLRADWAAYAGDVMSVTPHVGIRYTNIDVDSYRGLDTGAMDVVEMPVGVKVAGNFETAGWKVTPAVDFTVVPQVGDKQVDTVVGAVDVIDNLYNTTLGVSAEYGNFTFGLNYRYGFGNNDRKNNSVNANVRYMF